VYREEVSQRIQLANSQGGWEGSHTDFKSDLGSSPGDCAKLLKHILAFANTPRRTDAYIIFGVQEDKALKTFEHRGVQGTFPAPETIYNLIQHYTKLREVFVDAYFVLGGKPTPYVTIPLQYEGPHVLSKPLRGAPDVLAAGEIVCRYGSSSIHATDRDVARMQDWESWFLDCRYEKNATTLVSVLAKRFPTHTALRDTGKYVRLVYDSAITDEFGTNVAPVLVHAYPGFEPVGPDAVQTLVADNEQPTFGRTLIGPRFSLAAKELSTRSGVRCLPLDEIYFVNDAYANLCRAFLQHWEKERSARHLPFIIDLDYQISLSGPNAEDHRSLLSFLEKQLETSERAAILVHGDFGGGKTTTAKELVAELCHEYLRGNTGVPKVLYVDVNNIDIRSRRDECIKSQLARYRLPHECVDGLITQVLEDTIHLVFDGVDEMARPHTAAGRLEAIELLRGIGNRRAAIYLVRSSYFPKLDEMISKLGMLADVDFATGQKRTVVAKILGLRQEQVNCFLDARLGVDGGKAVRSGLHQVSLASFLEDPLIISFVADLVEEHGTASLGSLPRKGQRAQFLSHLVEQLLKREQTKRHRHGALDFELFQRILRSVAFGMVARSSTTIVPSQLEAVITRAVEPGGSPAEAVDAFRTMSWIHRADEGELSFRQEALTVVCAAEHICAAFERRDTLALSEWQSSAPLAPVVASCASEVLDGSGLLGATAILGGELPLPFNVRTVVTDVLKLASEREQIPSRGVPKQIEGNVLAAICRGIVTAPDSCQHSIQILFSAFGEKRWMQVAIPLMWLLSRKDLPGSVRAALTILGSKIRPKYDFSDELRIAKKDPSSFLDSMLLKQLRLSASDLLDLVQYETLFQRINDDSSIDRHAVQYADRTLKAVGGEKQRREKQFRKHAKA